MDINRFIIQARKRMPNASWQRVAQEVNDRYPGIGLTSSAVNHRYLRAINSERDRRGEGDSGGTEYPGRRNEAFPDRYRDLTRLSSREGNVLVIGDTHLPFVLQGYLDFLLDVQYRWDCGTVIHIGDFVDNYALSQFAHDPNGYSAGDEYDRMLDMAVQWYEAFPEVLVCIGNHDQRHLRAAIKAGIPAPFMRGYEELFGQPPGWKWGMAWELNDVVYEHGSGGGINAPLRRAQSRSQSIVMGHIHTGGGVQWFSNGRNGMLFGMNVGCGIDRHKYAFAYSGQSQKLPTLGCGVVTDMGRVPIFIPYGG